MEIQSPEELRAELEALKRETEENPYAYSGHQVYRPQPASPQNAIVEWQLNLDKELELIHHQIRGHIIKRDREGNELWTAPEDEEQALLNEKGAQEIEKLIRNYLNKNLLLSNYSEAIIRERVMQFAHRLRRFIFLNYEEFGLTTYYKQKHFEMIVMNVVDMVEAAYYRALNGGERESLTTIRQVIQSENIDNRQHVPPITSMGGGRRGGFFGRLLGR